MTEKGLGWDDLDALADKIRAERSAEAAMKSKSAAGEGSSSGNKLAQTKPKRSVKPAYSKAGNHRRQPVIQLQR